MDASFSHSFINQSINELSTEKPWKTMLNAAEILVTLFYQISLNDKTIFK